MRQGVLTALAMLIVAEWYADRAKVRVEQAVADTQYGDQKTDGSSMFPRYILKFAFRRCFSTGFVCVAAAQTWKVEQSTCRTEKGVVIHTLSGKRLPYGDLIEVAGKLKPIQ